MLFASSLQLMQNAIKFSSKAIAQALRCELLRMEAEFFNMLMVAEGANGDRPPIGFCIQSLLGSKYDDFFAFHFGGLTLKLLQQQLFIKTMHGIVNL
jgi:hypothetical protein